MTLRLMSYELTRCELCRDTRRIWLLWASYWLAQYALFFLHYSSLATEYAGCRSAVGVYLKTNYLESVEYGTCPIRSDHVTREYHGRLAALLTNIAD